MARGQQTLFANLFETQKSAEEQKQRTRNFYLPERNKCLVYRYYFHAEIKRSRYDDCLADLEKEFFITESRLVVVLTECSDLIRQVISERPGVKELQVLYPHFAWKPQN
jgi:hypothetical protein